MLARRYRRGAETLMHDSGRMLAEMKLFHSCLKNSSLVFLFSLQRQWLNMKVFFVRKHMEGLLRRSCNVPVCSDTIKKKHLWVGVERTLLKMQPASTPVMLKSV